MCKRDISNVIMTAVLWRKYLIKSENTWVARQNLSGPSFLQSTLSHLFIHLLLVGSDQHHLLKQSLMDFQSTAFVKTINGWISNCLEFWIAWGKSVSVFGRDCVRLPWCLANLVFILELLHQEICFVISSILAVAIDQLALGVKFRITTALLVFLIRSSLSCYFSFLLLFITWGKSIWVKFPRKGILAKMWSFFFKVEPSCD